MSERMSNLPKRSEQRNSVARQLREARSTDQRLSKSENRDRSTRNRSGEVYKDQLNGLGGFFDHVRTLPSTVVLDIGAGSTRGAADLARNSIAKGTDLRATVLSHDDRISENLGTDKTYHTSVELLRGIADNSVGGMIGLSSIAYSINPTLAVASIDRVLVPGGILKARFRARNEGSNTNPGFKGADSFIRELKLRGYDVAEDENARVILALKPDDTTRTSAKRVMRKDAKSLRQNAKTIAKNF